ncbi:hypothetical protein L596_017258 [Steinernema carpocapsae]|uniref:Serine-threonine/tyrosine-protein kinase catalytic domain-containing protein n=1 Tax=Steinernema carpocapsae TaxID=34508 RepID=A0A4U5N137_STECR|nr:hypothetical protein L596_017258 [Steinernema carpocapsae]
MDSKMIRRVDRFKYFISTPIGYVRTKDAFVFIYPLRKEPYDPEAFCEPAPPSCLKKPMTRGEAALQLAKTVKYLHELQCVIRDVTVQAPDHSFLVMTVAQQSNGFHLNTLHDCEMRYRAPETIQLDYFSQRTDIYALSVHLWELFVDPNLWAEWTPERIAKSVENGHLPDFVPPECENPAVVKLLRDRIFIVKNNTRPSIDVFVDEGILNAELKLVELPRVADTQNGGKKKSVKEWIAGLLGRKKKAEVSVDKPADTVMQ